MVTDYVYIFSTFVRRKSHVGWNKTKKSVWPKNYCGLQKWYFKEKQWLRKQIFEIILFMFLYGRHWLKRITIC